MSDSFSTSGCVAFFSGIANRIDFRRIDITPARPVTRAQQQTASES
jgi:hypothetical protein